MKFSELSKTFEQLEKTSSGNEIRKILAELFKQSSKDEIDKISYLILGQISSQYADLNMGMAAKMVLKSVAVAAGEDETKVVQLYKLKGDTGLVAEQLVGRKRKELSVKEVFEGLHKIAKSSGSGSQEQKIKLLSGLLKNASALEARYLARIVQGNLRLGVGDKAVLDALSIRFTGTKEAKKELEKSYNICPDVGLIARTIATKGISGIRKIGIVLGVPIQSMLCQRVKTLSEVKAKLGYPVVVEEKYDGERVQVHKNGNKITLYSRRLENITLQFPDMVAAVKKSVKANKCVLDSEVMSIDAKGNLLKFQTLMQRRRKYDIEKYIKKIPVALFIFDILSLNGKSLIQEQYQKRYSILQKTIKQTKDIKLAMHKLCSNGDCIEEVFQHTIEHGGEGVVIKDLKGPYQAGVRGWHWVKWKPEYVKGLRDTFDLVVIGAYHGRGKRAGTYGALLCAVYNEKNDNYETFCKLGTGLTDKTLAELPKKLKKYEISKKPARVIVTKPMTPDVWFSPGMVVEVAGAEITKSPNHSSGVALRFPRFLRYREKKPSQATTTKEIKRISSK